MTQTLEPPTQSISPQQRVDAWLADFEAGLAARDIDRVVAMFAVDSFWRDLVTVTWNLKTVEGRDGIADMLTARLADVGPQGFRTTETPDEADGVTSAWIEFETATARGKGHLRLRTDAESGESLAWTLLTTMQELKGYEEPRGHARPARGPMPAIAAWPRSVSADRSGRRRW